LKRAGQFDIALLGLTGFVRSPATGFVGVVLGVYLFQLGHGSAQIGMVTAAGLAGTAAATALITLRGDKLGRRRALISLALLWFVGGLGLALALVSSFAGLAFWVFIGMVNAMGTDRSAAYALEQSVRSLECSTSDRAASLARSFYPHSVQSHSLRLCGTWTPFSFRLLVPLSAN
jgi:MFS family permease